MNIEWFARAVLFVADMHRSLDFYVSQLGFAEAWRYGDHADKPVVAQVERQGCALILSSQWSQKVSNAVTFVSLNIEVPPEKLGPETTSALDRLRTEFAGRGVDVKESWWGYRLLVISDPDGNELWFNYPDARPPASTG